jgi:hypothetical protein
MLPVDYNHVEEVKYDDASNDLEENNTANTQKLIQE